ncbi:MAG TPA: hypothetical protein VJB91_02420, partial [Patescibacteria group bacterium]|nr:hypothetical protein [Patescibacteria group bacterium]
GDTSASKAAIYKDSGATELLGIASSGTADWGSYIQLTTPTGGWSWSVLQGLSTRLYATSGSNTLFYKVEILVRTVDTLTEIDYLFSDATDVYWNTVVFTTPVSLAALTNYPVLANNSNYEKPGTSTTWAVSDLDNVQLGYRLSSIGTNNAQISTVWLLVDYTVNATSTSSTPTAYSFQRKTFYDSTNDRYWRFYNDGSVLVMQYSTDYGANWNSISSLSENTNDFSVWNDAASVYLAYYDTYDIRVREGKLGSSSINWGAEYTALDGSGSTDTYQYAFLSQDSSGYLWVVGRYYNGSNYYMRARISSSVNDPSSWNATVHDISDTSNIDANTYGMIIPESTQDMYAIWIKGTSIEGRQWDNDASGDKWDPDKTESPDAIATGKSGLTSNLTAAADTNSTIHLAYIDGSDYVQYQSCSAPCSGSFNSATRLDTSATNTNVTVSIDSQNNNVYVLYFRSNVIYYKKYTSSWGGETNTGWSSASTNFTSGSQDGEIIKSGADWTTVRSASSGDTIWTGNADVTTMTDYSGGTYTIKRSYLVFDSSSLPDDAVIVSATIRLGGTWISGSGGELHIVQGTQGATLTTSDYPAIGSTSYGSETFTGNFQTKTITLNSSGISNISLTGSSYFAVLEDHDLDNTTPTGSAGTAFNASEGGTPPRLTVNYTTTLSQLTSNYSSSGRIFAEWTNGTSSPYTINWNYIIIPERLIFFLGMSVFFPLVVKRKRIWKKR